MIVDPNTVTQLFGEVRKSSVTETIVNQVKQRLLDGRLVPGQRLPSEREMAEQLRVGRSTVREATSAMVALGIVEIRPGDGVYIRSDFPQSTIASASWSSLVMTGHTHDLVEARRAIEVATARLASERATPQQLRDLHSQADQMDVASTLEEFIELDLAFHFTIAHASQNLVLREVMVGIQQLLRGSMVTILQTEEMRALSNRQHHSLCDALERRDADAAEAVILAHLKKHATVLSNMPSARKVID
jgi:GntR family transcriptional repressor for pyruvate dehydrogenase complex